MKKRKKILWGILSIILAVIIFKLGYHYYNGLSRAREAANKMITVMDEAQLTTTDLEKLTIILEKAQNLEDEDAKDWSKKQKADFQDTKCKLEKRIIYLRNLPKDSLAVECKRCQDELMKRKLANPSHVLAR